MEQVEGVCVSDTAGIHAPIFQYQTHNQASRIVLLHFLLFCVHLSVLYDHGVVGELSFSYCQELQVVYYLLLMMILEIFSTEFYLEETLSLILGLSQ